MSEDEVAALGGVWVRDFRAIEGGPGREPSDVCWVQAGTYFADVRRGRPGAEVGHWLDRNQGFSGAITVEGSAITWWHDLDTMPRPPGHHDVGVVERRGDRLVERGPGYEEHWRRESTAGASPAVLELRCTSPGSGEGKLMARVVRVGDLAAAVWAGNPGGGAVLTGRGWPERCRIGGADLLGDVQRVLRQPEAQAPPPWHKVL